MGNEGTGRRGLAKEETGRKGLVKEGAIEGWSWKEGLGKEGGGEEEGRATVEKERRHSLGISGQVSSHLSTLE